MIGAGGVGVECVFDVSQRLFVLKPAKLKQVRRSLDDSYPVIALVFVDENPEELVKGGDVAIHGGAEVVVPIDNFPVQLGAQRGLALRGPC